MLLDSLRAKGVVAFCLTDGDALCLPLMDGGETRSDHFATNVELSLIDSPYRKDKFDRKQYEEKSRFFEGETI